MAKARQQVQSFALDDGARITLTLGERSSWRKVPPGWTADQAAPSYRASRFEEVSRSAEADLEDAGDGEGAESPSATPLTPSVVDIHVAGGSADGGALLARPTAPAGAEPEGGGDAVISEEELSADLRALAGAGAPPRAAPAAAVAIPAAHDVFDRMRMGVAQTFDAGAFDLARSLDAFDARLADEERAAARRDAPPPEVEPDPTPAEAHAEALEDVERVREAALEPTRPVSLLVDVPLVAAGDRLGAHAAAAAMIVAWRDGLAGVDAAQIASGAGSWAPYQPFLAASGPRFFRGFGLTIVHRPRWDVEALRAALATHGPLWFSSDPPDEHARVVTGVVGDGTPAGTRVRVNDPWDEGRTAYAAPNQGSTYELPFDRFAAERQLVAHLPRADLERRPDRREAASAARG